MALLTVTNNSASKLIISDPGSSAYVAIPATETGTMYLDQAMSARMGSIVASLRKNAQYVVDLDVDANPADQFSDTAKSDVAFWLGNRVTVGLTVANPSTGSSVSARRVNIAAGEIYVDGVHTSYGSAANDNVGDAQITLTGANQGNLSASTDYRAALVYHWDAGTLKRAFVYAAAGASAFPTDAEIASALQAKYVLTAPLYAFVRVANVLFSVAGNSAVTQTTTNLRGIFASY